MDIARTQGDILGLETALKANPALKGDAEALRETKEYKAEMKKYGTGSALQQGIQAATAAIQGLAGGDMAKALAGASAPYLAEVIHNMTLDPTRKGGVNTEANLMAHAVLGAVVAQVNGNSALAGASGAVMGEYIAQQMYPGIAREDLNEEQRQTLSALGTLAAGLAGGLAGGSTADTVAGAQAGKNAVENNALLLLMAPPPPVAGQAPQSEANTVITQKLDDAVKEFGREAVKQCLSGGDCPLPVQVALLAIQAMMGQGENGSNPNIGKDLTDEQKKELGGSGSGTPGGWGPQDEEAGRNNNSSSDPKGRGQHEEYVDSLRASMEKPNVKDENLKNIIDDLYRPNAKVGSGSTADAVRYELATGEKVGGRGHVEKAQTYSKALQDWLNKNPQASSSDKAAAENVLKDMQNALKGK
ncbi:putative hemolysin [Yersinia intermedia]|uniref:Putative hemolysin n=2 Tax=Yersinia intermedia TaxID=631 RepID=A0A0H5M1C5_YERIN|nr:putative hemolysin [Yersinia intermedia]